MKGKNQLKNKIMPKLVRTHKMGKLHMHTIEKAQVNSGF